MRFYNKTERPDELTEYTKRTAIRAAFLTEPFALDTQEGVMTFDETHDGWQRGYWIAYPDDGSEPYAISSTFMAANYVATAAPQPEREEPGT